MTVKDAVIETLDALPISQQKELLRIAKLLQAKMKPKRRPTKKPKQQTMIRESRFVMDEELGFTVLDAGPDAPVLTNEMVREMLADFP